MFTQRTAIGLDARPRFFRAGSLDITGEVLQAKLLGGNDAVTISITGIATEYGPVAGTYEAGPSGFGLARTLVDVDYPVTVAAPSRLLRPSGDKVKTDACDALLLARLLKIDELVAVRVPTIAEESARDLVRVRDEARVELMTCRHRLSKLLLRRNFGCDGSVHWGTAHEAWLRRIRKNELTDTGQGTLAAFDAAFDAATLGLTRRERLDNQIS